MKNQLQAKRVLRLLFTQILVFIFVLFSSMAFTQVSGVVWQDLPVNGTTVNTYGVKEANELGLEGVTVTIYPGGMSTTTASDGTYSIAGAPAGAVRVEFSWPALTWLQSSPDAVMQNTSVQFVTAPMTGVDFGLHNPSVFSNLNPDIILPAYISGDPNGGGIAATTGTLVLHGYTDMGTNTPSTLLGAPTIVNFGDIGATYGGVWQRESKTYLTSAFAKRYVGLKNDPGSVFRVDDPAGTPTVSEYFSLDALGFSAGVIGARGLPADYGPSHDVDMFAQVGTVSLGDMEFDAAEENLYIVNLFDKKLYKVNVGNPAKAVIVAGDVSSFSIPDPGCVNGNWRPFALGLDETRNVMLIGGICDAATGTRADLRAYVYEFDLTTQTMGAAAVLDFSLSFSRGHVGAGGDIATHWNPWSDAPADWLLADAFNSNRFHPEPLLADIEIEVDGSLILGFRDVWGDRWGTQNYSPDPTAMDLNTYHTFSNGDLYKAKLIGGVYELENNGQFSDGTMGCGVGNGDGPGGGEFYCEDFFGAHANIPKGALAYLQGDSHFVSVSQDPLAADSGGTKWMSIVPGSSTQNYQIYRSTIGDGSFYKANGLGDVELLFDSAPIEIGNLVWEDTDGDGVQDPGEAGISGITVQLMQGASVIETATTDTNGNYIFSNDPNGTTTGSHRYDITTLTAAVAYTVRIPNASGVSQQTALMTPGLSLTTANIGEGSNTDMNDSDGGASGDNADALVLVTDIPRIGANNHTFDFGFSTVSCPAPRCGTTIGAKN